MPWKFLLPVLLVPVIYLVIALTLTAFAPQVDNDESLNFERLRSTDPNAADLQRMKARDGATLAYAHYPSDNPVKLILLHGSGYHSAYLAPLARHIAQSGAADVYALNIRGHEASGTTRGDIEHVGQLEDDIADFIEHIRVGEPQARFVVGGHSSGGALAIRFAASPHGALAVNTLGLAPILGHRAPTALETAGGWAHISLPRIIGLSMLNTVGIHALDHLPTIRFNLPPEFRDGSETLTYSWRLMTNFNLHDDFHSDIAALQDTALVLVGRNDEAMNAEAFPSLFKELGKPVELVDGTDHFSLVIDPDVFGKIGTWLRQQ